jgi:hypothetical protein
MVGEEAVRRKPSEQFYDWVRARMSYMVKLAKLLLRHRNEEEQKELLGLAQNGWWSGVDFFNWSARECSTIGVERGPKQLVLE